MCFTGMIAIVALFLLPGGESQVSLTRTMPSGMQSVCPNATAIFTCRVSRSSALQWISTDYIGLNQVAFASSSLEGTTEIVNSDVVAVLTRNSGNVLESELRVRASVNSAIRCQPDNANSGVTVNLTVYDGFPGKPTGIGATEILVGDTCVTSVKWDPPADIPPENISHYIVRDSVNEQIIASTDSTLVSFESSQCTGNRSISVSAIDRCEQEGPSVNVQPNFIPPVNPLTDITRPSGTLNSATTTIDPSSAANASSAAIALGVVMVLVVTVMIAMIVLILAIYIFRSRRRTQQSTGVEEVPLIELDEAKINEDEQPKYDKDDIERRHRFKKPKRPTQAQERDTQIFMSEVVILFHTVEVEEVVAMYDRLKPPLNLGYTLCYKTITGIDIILGMFGNHKAALICKGVDCQDEIEGALESLPEVKLIIAMGFAYGKRDKCKLGDVLVSTTVYGVSNIRIDESGKIKIDGDVCHTEISANAKRTFTKKKWIDFVCTRGEDRESEVHCGVVVSSPMLVSSRNTLEKLITRQERFIGGEMEGQQLAQLTSNDEKYHHVDFIVIKGVAAFEDGMKEKDWQFTASLAAATFTERRLEESENRVYYLQHGIAESIDGEHLSLKTQNGDREKPVEPEKGSLTKLIGENIVMITSDDWAEVPVSTLDKEGSVVGLFFSAHACRIFTPKLVSWYNKFKSTPNGHLMNIIFVSSDSDEDQFWKCFKDMPWYSLYYSHREKKEELENKFFVKSIPTLVFVDGKTGKLITKEGCEIVVSDPHGYKFPWNPPSFSEIITDSNFIGHGQKQNVTWSDIEGHIIGLLFSVPQSKHDTLKTFSCELAVIYNKLKERGKKFEIIYVDCNKDESAWRECVKGMPWLALPFEDKRVMDLASVVDINETPTLIILDEKGDVITTRGYNSVQSDPDGLAFPWYVNCLTEDTAEDISATPSLIWFVPNDMENSAKEILEQIAKGYLSKCAKAEVELLFFLSCSSHNDEGIVNYIRSIATLQDTTKPLMIILDISQKKVYICDSHEVTGDCVQKFLTEHHEKGLVGKPLAQHQWQRRIEANVLKSCVEYITHTMMLTKVNAKQFGTALAKYNLASETDLSTLMSSPDIVLSDGEIKAILKAVESRIREAQSPEEAKQLFYKVIEAFDGLLGCMDIAHTLVTLCKMKGPTCVSPIKDSEEACPCDAQPDTKGAHAE